MAQETDPEQVFEILERLGEGSYGSVYKARHKKSNRIVAVKIIPADSDLNDLMKEITILKECKSDFIIRYYGSYYKDGDLWIVMEYGECGSVSDSLNKESNVFSELEIQYILGSILLGIAYLHDNKKIHRDIKAGNVLLTKDGKAKLADFGVSAKLDSTLSKRNTVIGTPFWMAPEIIQEISYGGKADIWSLGITAIELADGQPPYSNIHPMRAIFMIPNRPPPRLRQNGKWSDKFADFVSSCLEKDPDRRPTARQLLQHPFVKNIAIELEANKGGSEVMRAMVDRLLIRKKEIALQRKDTQKNDAVADFGNTLISTKSKCITDPRMSHYKEPSSDSGTIVIHDSTERTSMTPSTTANIEEPLSDSTVREIHSASAYRQPHRMNPILHEPPSSQQPPVAVPRPVQPAPSPPKVQQAREQYFPSGGLTPSQSAGVCLPITHLQMLLGNVKPQSDVQKLVMPMMPEINSKQPVQGTRTTEWMRLRRKGEELRQQFGTDLQVLYDTYYTELKHISDDMKIIETSTK